MGFSFLKQTTKPFATFVFLGTRGVILVCEWPGTGGMVSGSPLPGPLGGQSMEGHVCRCTSTDTQVGACLCAIGVPGVHAMGSCGHRHPLRAPPALLAPRPALAPVCCLFALRNQIPT